MVERHLLKIFASLNPPRELKNSVALIFQSTYKKVCESIKAKIHKASKPKNIVKVNPEPKKTQTRSLSSDIKIVRKNYLENFIEKLGENKTQAAKFIKDQKKREERQKQREEEFQKKRNEEFELEERLREEERLKQEIEKHKKIEKLRMSSERRKNELSYYKELLVSKDRESGSVTPYYKHIEEEFVYKVEIPELERRKRELQQKREMFKPISLSEIREHAKKVEAMMQEIQTRKKQSQRSRILDERIANISHIKTKMLVDVIKEKRQVAEAETLKYNEKKNRYDKKKQYSQIVNEMFPPSIDKFKEQEMKLIKARLQIPVKLKTPNLTSNDNSRTDYTRSVSVQPHKWKRNNMIPEPPEKREGKPVFYLEEQRKKRNVSESVDTSLLSWKDKVENCEDSEEKLKILKINAEKLEKAAKRLELKLNSKNLNVDMAKKVDDLLINSIRAKLDYLK
ncbi:hypothetical protein SteCoe_14826 [Stentor coeruleus]|uniref:Uncharacterized protein n=1 Tax=Stentor coeruleus TaxID=5963 RepID=A0A1R2C532_9CILI|nr:hypothetical protein SteCoe_14826 [Stentor coeruleus]